LIMLCCPAPRLRSLGPLADPLSLARGVSTEWRLCPGLGDANLALATGPPSPRPKRGTVSPSPETETPGAGLLPPSYYKPGAAVFSQKPFCPKKIPSSPPWPSFPPQIFKPKIRPGIAGGVKLGPLWRGSGDPLAPGPEVGTPIMSGHFGLPLPGGAGPRL
jgi:hypothetical protein